MSERTPLSEFELSIWNSRAFQRQFTESYIAETEIEPRVTQDERETMEEVLELIKFNRPDDAARKLERERSRNEGASAVFDFTLANIYFQQDRLELAVLVYQMAVDKYPKFRRAWKNLALVHIRQNEFEKALPALIRVIELGDHDAISYGLLGYAYSSLEDHLAAESAYRMAILLDPDTLDWKMGLARSFFKQERYSEAVSLCKNLLANEPEREDLWMLQANAHIGMNRPVEAAKIYELVDHLGKSSVDSLNMLGDIYTNEELYELAVDSYARAMEMDQEGGPDRALRAAKVLAARGALEETKDLVEQIETLHGGALKEEDRKDLLKLRARMAVAEGSGEEEVRVLQEIVELDPLDGEALILLGQHSGRTGEPERAVFYFERAAAIEEFEAEAKLRQAQLLVGNQRYAEALPLLRRVQQLEPRENVQKYLEEVERLAKSRS